MKIICVDSVLSPLASRCISLFVRSNLPQPDFSDQRDPFDTAAFNKLYRGAQQSKTHNRLAKLYLSYSHNTYLESEGFGGTWTDDASQTEAAFGLQANQN